MCGEMHRVPTIQDRATRQLGTRISDASGRTRAGEARSMRARLARGARSGERTDVGLLRAMRLSVPCEQGRIVQRGDCRRDPCHGFSIPLCVSLQVAGNVSFSQPSDLKSGCGLENLWCQSPSYLPRLKNVMAAASPKGFQPFFGRSSKALCALYPDPKYARCLGVNRSTGSSVSVAGPM